MGFISADIQPLAPVASSMASAILPVLFSGNDSALMMSASDMAANAGDKLRHKTKLQSWKKRFMRDDSLYEF
jgi:hypothetical protein